MSPKENATCGTFLGLDLSTQKLKAIQLDGDLKVIATAEVKFDCDLPEFRTSGGVNAGPNKNEYFVQPVMWVKAIDIVLDRLVVQGADFNSVIGIGGSAQQHGSLYWSRHGINTIKSLNPEKFLHQQIDDSSFVLNRAPIWMDASAEKQCVEMEIAIGGCEEMALKTGSKCYPRFTGPQIRKVYQQKENAYEEAQRISLVSSFLASIFLGDVAPIDYADGSGMNLLDIKSKQWSEECLNACAPDLADKLDTPKPTCSIIGRVCYFFVERFGFSPECKVSAFTGDNPSALSGMLVEASWLVMSLGTSDTLMMTLDQQPYLQEGHVLCHPTDPTKYMGLLCFRNGSLVRDYFKKHEAKNSWTEFNELLESTPRGNYGNMALHFHSKEIIPNVKATLRWNKTYSLQSPDASVGVSKFGSPELEIRALIEGQMLHRRLIATDMGFHFGDETKIVVTGGASINQSMLQIISDVFGAPVYIIEDGSEAALFGAAYRAKYSIYLEEFAVESPTSVPMSYHDYMLQFIPNLLRRVCEPNKDCNDIYGTMLERCRQMLTVLKTSYTLPHVQNRYDI